VAVGVVCPVEGVFAYPVLLVGAVWPAVLGVVLGVLPVVVRLVVDGLLPVVLFNSGLFNSGVLFLFSICFLLDGYVRRELIIKN
jgi:hypothetical protein